MFIEDVEAEKRLICYLGRAGLSLEDVEKWIGGNYIIFGGAVRDALAGEENCRDIDILCHIDPFMFPQMTLVKDYCDTGYSKNMIGYCKRMGCSRVLVDFLSPKDGDGTFFSFIKFLSETDFSTSAIGYNERFGFIEAYPKAILHCKRKVFSVRTEALGYNPSAVGDRINRLENNGWLKI